jgi:hypothetical protein
MTGAIARDRQRCQFPFGVDEKPTFVTGGSAGARSGGAQKVPLGRHWFELRASGAVGLRWQAVFGCQIIWNRSKRCAGERGGARVGRPRWLRILTITGGSSIAALRRRLRTGDDLQDTAVVGAAFYVDIESIP